jgi:uncharacterized repeat protein (TIGR04076 family)
MPAPTKIRVAAVRGTCNARFEAGDAFYLKGIDLVPRGHDRTCCVAFASVVANVGRLKFVSGPIYVSCPDPGTGAGGNVLFELVREEGDGQDRR